MLFVTRWNYYGDSHITSLLFIADKTARYAKKKKEAQKPKNRMDHEINGYLVYIHI